MDIGEQFKFMWTIIELSEQLTTYVNNDIINGWRIMFENFFKNDVLKEDDVVSRAR